MVVRATPNDSTEKDASSGGFFSRIFGGGSTTDTDAGASSSADPTPASSQPSEAHKAAAESISVPSSSLKNIKTPHEDPISHPELAFTPSEIGIWEINKEKSSGKKSGGFWS